MRGTGTLRLGSAPAISAQWPAGNFNTGNPVYSVENHVEQVNNAIAAKPDVIITSLESVGLVPAFQKAQAAGITIVIFDQGIDAEAAKLHVPVINQDELAARVGIEEFVIGELVDG